MNSDAKISYEKPIAVDLGPTAPVVGASCVPGKNVGVDVCDPLGNNASVGCEQIGNSAGHV
jgi:hypothetical protein